MQRGSLVKDPVPHNAAMLLPRHRQAGVGSAVCHRNLATIISKWPVHELDENHLTRIRLNLFMEGQPLAMDQDISQQAFFVTQYLPTFFVFRPHSKSG